MKSYHDKVFIIMGSLAGIGKTYALEFAIRSAMGVLASKNETELLKVGTEIRSRNGTAFSVTTGVRNKVDCRNLVGKTIKKYGKNKITTIEKDIGKDYLNRLKKTLMMIISTGDKPRMSCDSANAFDFCKAKKLIKRGQNETKQPLENNDII